MAAGWADGSGGAFLGSLGTQQGGKAISLLSLIQVANQVDFCLLIHVRGAEFSMIVSMSVRPFGIVISCVWPDGQVIRKRGSG